MCLEINYKIGFSVLVICKWHVNMHMALRKIQVSLLLFLPFSHSRLPRKLSVHLVRASQNAGPSHISWHSPLHQLLSLASPHLAAT